MENSVFIHVANSRHTVELPKIWSDALTEWTSNNIPIHLIDLSNLRMVSRLDVAEYYYPILAADLEKNPSRQVASQGDVTRTLSKLVRYAMFSHRWLKEGELTLRDMHNVSKFADVLTRGDEATLARTLDADVPNTTTRAGLCKFLFFCSKARSYKCPFAWADTCCIDKDSSAELDESIRSMFRWYRNAYICIVHLASSLVLNDIVSDEWFTRSWTLQELLAPRGIRFYNREWKAFTEAWNDKDPQNNWKLEKEKNPVWKAILEATNIPPSRLSDFKPGAFDVAQRLSWAANRRTTRIEDVAYALMGIFGIYMPVQYGEGKFAFQRLMEALLERAHGYDIFAWTGRASQYSAALPASIEGYLAAKAAEHSARVPYNFGDPSMTFTHKGLQLEVLLVPMQCKEMDDDRREREAGSGPDADEGSDQETDWEEDSGQERQSGEGDQNDFVTGPDMYSSSTDLINDVQDPWQYLHIDDDYNDDEQFSWFHFTHADGVFKPVSVHGCRPSVSYGLFPFPDVPARHYAFAILDYYRDSGREQGCVLVPYCQKSKYLAFVLYKDTLEGTVWKKLETDMLVYVEVETGKECKGQTVNICL